jgi:hypothetical protein
VITFACVVKRLYTQTSSCHGPSGGAPAAGVARRRGVGRAHPTALPPPPTWRGGARYPPRPTQKLRPISNYDTLLSHVLPLARFGAPSTYVTTAWCGPITIMLAREVGAPNNTTRRFSMHLLVAAKAHHRSGAFHSRHIGLGKGKLHI